MVRKSNINKTVSNSKNIISVFGNIATLLLIVIGLNVNAQIIEESQAVQVASNFYMNHFDASQLKSGTAVEIKLSEKEVIISENTGTLKSAETRPAYYIFNYGNDEGFIIIAGDERAKPILGYSKNGSYNAETAPIEVTTFLNNYKLEISEIVNKDVAFKVSKNEGWDKIISGTTKSGELSNEFYLIQSSWGQGRYYNNLTPADEAVTSSFNGHTPAGCVAIVMSQLMRYWEWPTTGEGSRCYTPNTHKEYGELCVDYTSISNNWDNMPDALTNESTNAEIEATSGLIYQSAVAVKMNFTPTGSSAYSSTTAIALKKFFNYSPKTKYVQKSNYSDSEWIELLKTHLDNKVPLYYRGDSNNSSAHAFILDGYDQDDRFHFNWGWNGRYDGFFALNALAPLTNYNFTSHQAAIINTFPNADDVRIDRATASKTAISEGETITIKFHHTYSGYDFNGLSSNVNIYFSTDQTFDSEDILLAEENIEFSSVNKSVEKNTAIILPGVINDGDYFILLIADTKNDIEETNELNNTSFISVNKGVQESNDFLVKNATINTNEVLAGAKVLLNCTPEYIGTNKSVEAQTGYYLSTDKNYDLSDLFLGENTSILSATESSEDVSNEVIIPEEVQPGSYHILFIADHANKYIELEENNNITASNFKITSCSDDLEPNDTHEKAFYIGELTDYFNDNLCLHTEDEDWVEFSIETETYFVKISNGNKKINGKYGLSVNQFNGVLTVETFEIEGNTDTKVSLFDKNLNILAENDDDNGDAFSKIIYRELAITTSTANVFSDSDFSLYPNPARGKVFIDTQVNIDQNITITLMDMRGTLLEKRSFENRSNSTNFAIDLSPYAEGQYIVGIYSNDGTFVTKKVMKNS